MSLSPTLAPSATPTGAAAGLITADAAPEQPELPALRLLPAPPCQPPYDDELPHPPVLRLLPPLLLLREGRAPLPTEADEERPSVLPGGSIPPLLTRVVGGPGAPDLGEAADLDDDAAMAADAEARRTAIAALPSPQRFCHALLQRLEEVLAGVRPVAQLQRDLTLEAFVALERRVAVLGRARRDGATRPGLRAVRSLHVQSRPEGVAEVCASVQRGPRRVAVALRLEGRDGAWQVTALVGV